MMEHGFDFGLGWGGMFLGPLIWIIIIIGLVFIIKWALEQGRSSSKSDEHVVRETPLEILKKRYARGEIDKEEDEEKKRTLTSD
ncbi:MAG: SHOCT domain-containing protein [Fidelibacterota bacterium]